MNQPRRIAVLDYQMSNLRSVVKAFESLGAHVTVVDGPPDPATTDGLVLPGVGNFGQAMGRIRRQRLEPAIHSFVDARRPLLGICLGMQLLFDRSEESPKERGLGLIPGVVRRLRTDRKLPHIGWSTVRWESATPLAPAHADQSRAQSTYYFVHTFCCEPDDPASVLGVADHGVQFTAAAGRGEVVGVQFHPEKSSAAGLALIERWLKTVERRPGEAA